MILKVETKEVYVVHEIKKWVYTWNTGDSQSYSQWEIKRKQMLSDIPKQNGGTMMSVCAYGESLLLNQNKVGVGSFGVFPNKYLADAYIKYLNDGK